MKKKRVLLIAPFPPPIGGDTVLALNLLKSEYWRRAGIEIDSVDTSPGDRVRVPDEKLTARDAIRGVRIMLRVLRKIPAASAVLLWANRRFVCTLGLPIVLSCLVTRKPIVVKAFGAMLAERIGTMGPVRKRLTTSLLNRTACVFPETRNEARKLIDGAGLSPARVVLFTNFLTDASLRLERRPRRFGGRCIFLGQIKAEKGVFDIVEALRGIEGFRCDFYGPIIDRDRGAFTEAVSRSGECSYRGPVDPDAVMETIAGYDVLLLPSYHVGEGYPAVILQAFAAGVPVIASSWRDIPELVENGVTGLLVPPREPARIREALARLAADRALYESMSAAAFKRSKEYSEKAVVGDVLVTKVSALLS
jgi:glycosyltransferase involved in cell wall biosynthesis